MCLRSLALALVSSVTYCPWLLAHGFVVSSLWSGGSSRRSGCDNGSFRPTITTITNVLPATTAHSSSRRYMAKPKKFTMNENLVGTINSDGIFVGRTTTERPKSSKLGVASSNKISKKTTTDNNTWDDVSPDLSKEDRQRTANGRMDSTRTDDKTPPAQQKIQVVEGKRGSKVVTMVR